MFVQDIKINQVERLIPDISHKTISKWYTTFRDKCKKHVGPSMVSMSADVENQIIEIDESVFGKKRKYNVGRATRQAWVFGLIQRGTRKVAFRIVEARSKEVLLPLIEEYVEKGATIYHDDWASYKKLEEIGYHHGTVVHKNEFVSQEGVCTNTIEGIWGDLKQKLRSMHGIPLDLLQDYLDEYAYRFMYKDTSGSIYHTFLNHLATS